MIHPSIYIASSKDRGRGVFTSEDLETGTLVEASPVIVLSAEDRTLIDQTRLHDYIFEWGDKIHQCCMALGYVAVYNHSYTSNCEYEMDFEALEIRIKTVTPVKAGQELYINYNGDWNDAKPVWFETK